MVFLGNLRSALIVSATIPFALAFAIGLMLLRGESANLLSMGAIDFGLIVDATVIMVENIYRRLSEPAHGRFVSSLILQRARSSMELGGKFAVIGHAAIEVNRAIFFSAAIIIAGFVPLFTMSGIEGHIFGPMAKTYAYAIAGGLIATFTIAPALSALLLREQVQETETIVVRLVRRGYRPVLRFALANRVLTLGGDGAVDRLRRIGGAHARVWSSCPSWRKAICGSARPCRPRSRSRKATATSTACGRSCGVSRRW